MTFELKWGISLIDFKPTLTTANQVKSVTVHGWNRSTKQPITGRASLDDPKLKLNRDLHKLLENCDAREERVVDMPVFSQKEADELRQGDFARRAARISSKRAEPVSAAGPARRAAGEDRRARRALQRRIFRHRYHAYDQ